MPQIYNSSNSSNTTSRVTSAKGDEAVLGWLRSSLYCLSWVFQFFLVIFWRKEKHFVMLQVLPWWNMMREVLCCGDFRQREIEAGQTWGGIQILLRKETLAIFFCLTKCTPWGLVVVLQLSNVSILQHTSPEWLGYADDSVEPNCLLSMQFNYLIQSVLHQGHIYAAIRSAQGVEFDTPT